MLSEREGPHYRNPLTRFSMTDHQRTWLLKHTRETGVFRSVYAQRLAQARRLAGRVLRKLTRS